MHITITGNLGSGKSTVCRILGDKYQFEVYSTGKVQRELASQMNMTTLELNQLMRTDKKYDKMIDDETARISRDNNDKDIIFDSRLAWHFVEKSFKVFVSVSLETAAQRVMNDQRGEVEKYSSFEEAKNLLTARADTERVRYKEIYNLNYMNYSNYNLVIDSTYCDQNRIAEIILQEAKEYEKNPSQSTKILVSPRRLILTDHPTENPVLIQQITEEYKKLPYVTDNVIKVVQKEDEYQVVEGFDFAKAAVNADICYVPIEVVKE